MVYTRRTPTGTMNRVRREALACGQGSASAPLYQHRVDGQPLLRSCRTAGFSGAIFLTEHQPEQLIVEIATGP
jgi:hypothetical protein